MEFTNKRFEYEPIICETHNKASMYFSQQYNARHVLVNTRNPFLEVSTKSPDPSVRGKLRREIKRFHSPSKLLKRYSSPYKLKRYTSPVKANKEKLKQKYQISLDTFRDMYQGIHNVKYAQTSHNTVLPGELKSKYNDAVRVPSPSNCSTKSFRSRSSKTSKAGSRTFEIINRIREKYINPSKLKPKTKNTSYTTIYVPYEDSTSKIMRDNERMTNIIECLVQKIHEVKLPWPQNMNDLKNYSFTSFDEFASDVENIISHEDNTWEDFTTINSQCNTSMYENSQACYPVSGSDGKTSLRKVGISPKTERKSLLNKSTNDKKVRKTFTWLKNSTSRSQRSKNSSPDRGSDCFETKNKCKNQQSAISTEILQQSLEKSKILIESLGTKYFNIQNSTPGIQIDDVTNETSQVQSNDFECGQTGENQCENCYFGNLDKKISTQLKVLSNETIDLNLTSIEKKLEKLVSLVNYLDKDIREHCNSLKLDKGFGCEQLKNELLNSCVGTSIKMVDSRKFKINDNSLENDEQSTDKTSEFNSSLSMIDDEMKERLATATTSTKSLIKVIESGTQYNLKMVEVMQNGYLSQIHDTKCPRTRSKEADVLLKEVLDSKNPKEQTDESKTANKNNDIDDTENKYVLFCLAAKLIKFVWNHMPEVSVTLAKVFNIWRSPNIPVISSFSFSNCVNRMCGSSHPSQLLTQTKYHCAPDLNVLRGHNTFGNQSKDCFVCHHQTGVSIKKIHAPFACKYCGRTFIRSYCKELHQQSCPQRGEEEEVDHNLLYLK